MSNQPLEQYRISAAEQSLRDYLARLHLSLDIFAMSVRAVIPSVNQLTLPNYPDIEKIDDLAMLSGRGPRFVGKYNTARSDQERQALLDSLPILSPNHRGTVWGRLSHLIENLTLHSEPTDSSIWTNWLNTAWTDECALTCDGVVNRLAEAAGLHQYTDNDHVLVAEEIRNVLWRPPGNKAKDNSEVIKMTLLGMPEIEGYVIIRVTQEANWDGMLLWNQHELCWNYLNQQYIPTNIRESAAQRYLTHLGLPRLDAVSEEEELKVYGQLAEFLKEHSDWYDDILGFVARPADEPKILRRTIALPDVMKLTVQSVSLYAPKVDRITITPLDDKSDALVHLPALSDWDYRDPIPRYHVNRSGYVMRPTEDISPHQKRRMINLILQFMEAPNHAYVIDVSLSSGEDEVNDDD